MGNGLFPTLRRGTELCKSGSGRRPPRAPRYRACTLSTSRLGVLRAVITKAAKDDAAVSPRMALTRELDCCSGVFMPGRARPGRTGQTSRRPAAVSGCLRRYSSLRTGPGRRGGTNDRLARVRLQEERLVHCRAGRIDASTRDSVMLVGGEGDSCQRGNLGEPAHVPHGVRQRRTAGLPTLPCLVHSGRSSLM